MRITVDRDLCQGHAMCELEAPEVFRVGSAPQVEILAERPAGQYAEAVRQAVRYCPTHALQLEEDGDG
ncbi:MAG TPA: ferredoxin [Mycobacteriales bacterium]|nr:ferredoxin [Mycobacteriales bacterium]